MKSLHATNDHVLNLLVNTTELLSAYVNAYPGKGESSPSTQWIERWFIDRAIYYLNNPTQDQAISLNAEELSESILSQQLTVVRKTFSIISILPHYFRGFRSVEYPINLTGKLVVIDGHNSTGKTSLAEAFEWLLSGQLIRRDLGDMGDSRELENCISNQFRPESESTWVETEFSLENGEKIKLKRVLTRDYDQTKNSKAESEFYLNGTLLTKDDEEDLLDEMLAGHAPVLMQHSLRAFVFSSPAQRRNYFERLLRLDELAHLIEKSVIGNARLPDFTSSTGSIAWKEWEEFKKLSETTVVKALKKCEKVSPQPLQILETTLQEYCSSAFGISTEGLTIEEAQRAVGDLQRGQREQGFPILDNLRPQKTVDPQLLDLYSENNLQRRLTDLDALTLAVKSAEIASKAISDTQLVITKMLEDLSKAGIFVNTKEPLTCPLCNYADTPTLTPERISEIQSWQPIQQAAQQAKTNLDEKINEIKSFIRDLVSAKNGLIPNLPSDADWEDALKNKAIQISESALVCKQKLQETHNQIAEFNQIIKSISELLKQTPSLQGAEQVKSLLTSLVPLLAVVVDKAQEYSDVFRSLEETIGKQSREDPNYNLREMWLSIVQKRGNLLADFAWERAKKNAQKEIENIRDALVRLRDKLVEARRVSFSEGMTAIWSKLRNDRYSMFSRLYIPPSSGRGLPVEIHVKAELNDGVQTKEVDALRVFSESQINILGIAAFATRSKLLGHRTIILDDPVQSMDEEHFKTFSNQLLPEFIGDDGQVIIFTHNDTFARELSFSWAGKDIDFYTTMSIDHRRKKGCVVTEGNRRVQERLKQAEKALEDGDLEKAWIAVRKSTERLCTLIRAKYGEPNFDHFSWRNTTTEDMLKQGVGTILDAKNFGTTRIKEILSMTAAAAHDKKLYQETDLVNSIKYIRELTVNLQIAG
ncbi:MAG: AAA family ATPase [Anaerolineae bacterium]|nr:AAA family ATPase [Anaerolineae bacterium]